MYSDKALAIIGRVRDEIGDRENRQNSISIRCTQPNTTSAILTIADETLTIDILPADDSSYPSTIAIDVDLADFGSLYDLVGNINDTGGYDVKVLGNDGSRDCRDLVPVSNLDILTKTATLQNRHWFSDAQIYSWVTDILRRQFSDYDIDTIEEEDELYISILAAMHGCSLRMADAAKYYGINVDGVTVNRGALVSQYQILYNNLQERLSDIGYTIQQGKLMHPSHITGRNVPTSQIVNATPVRFISADVSGSDVTLTWRQCIDRDWFAYEVYRNSGSGYENIKTGYTRTLVSYEDTDLEPGTYTYKIRNVISLAVPKDLSYPASPPSEMRKYADSREIVVVVPEV